MRWMLRFSPIVLLLLPVALCQCSSATGSPDAHHLCTQDNDCFLGQTCNDGLCVPGVTTCTQPSDCPSGQVCRHGACVAGETDGGIDGGDGQAADAGDPGGPQPRLEVVSPPATGDPPVYQLDFGNVKVGVTVEKQVVVENAGDAPLKLLQLNFETGSDGFSVTQALLSSLPVTVAPGDQFTIDVQFNAVNGLTAHGVLDIVSNDPANPLVKIHLLSEFKGNALAQVQPTTLAFGDIPVGQSSQPLTFTVSNQGTGNAVLTVQDIRLGILANPDLTLTASDSNQKPVTFPALLNNGDFLTGSVVYHPQRGEDDSDAVVVVTDDPTHTTLQVAITGRGVTAGLDVQPSPIDLGRVRVGHHGEQTVSMTNNGGAPLAISGVSLTGLGNAWSLSSSDLDLPNLATSPHTLNPAGSVTVKIAFDPTAASSDAGNLKIDNQSGIPTRNAAVGGTGYIAPKVQTQPSPAQLDLGEVQFDAATGIQDHRTLPLIIQNIGGDPLQTTNIQRAAGTSPEFSFSPQSLSPINGGQQATLQVSFQPSSAGTKSGAILVDTNDPDLSQDGVTGRFAILVSGKGVDPNVLVQPASIDFGSVVIGTDNVVQVTVRDNSVDPLLLQDIHLGAGTSPAFTLAALPTIPRTIAGAADSATFEVHYLATGIGNDSGSVLVLSNDLGNPQVTVALAGRGGSCPAGFGDCNPSVPGCETPLNTLSNCGGCSQVCDPPNATGDCSTLSCKIGTCDGGFGDCNHSPGDGCETSLNTNQNCGGCGVLCNPATATGDCSDGTCQIALCNTGFGDCDHNPSNGCETPLNTNQNCGGCGVLCNPANATGDCSSGGCQIASCNPGFCNLDGQVGDGCEQSLNTNPACNSALPIGSVQGDNGSDLLVHQGFGQQWMMVNVVEANSSPTQCVYLSATLRLYPPANTDYDLYVYCDNCTNTAGISQNSGSTMEQVDIRWEEDCWCAFGVCVPSGSDSGRPVYVLVKYFSGAVCDNWQLEIYGNTPVGLPDTCSTK